MYPAGHRGPECDPAQDTPKAGEAMRQAGVIRLRGAGMIRLTVFGLLFAAVSGAAARTPLDILTAVDADRVRAELERTDQVLVRAAEHTQDCESIRGRGLLREGRKIQGDAWARFRGTAGSPQEQRRNQATALRMTRTARDLAVKAIETCQVEFQAHQSITSMLDSTRELAGEAAALVRASRSADGQRLLDAGIRQLEHAMDAYRNRDLRRAITLGAAARRLIQRAMQRAQAGEGSGGSERTAGALERTEQVLQDLSRHIGSGDRRAKALLERARSEQDLASAHYRDGRYEQALRLTQAARRSVLDALWEAQKAPDRDRVAGALEIVERVMQETGPEILRSGDQESMRLLEAAGGQIESAHRLLAQGDAARAAQAVRTADSLLRRASESAGR